jgi:hypothetical protein
MKHAGFSFVRSGDLTLFQYKMPKPQQVTTKLPNPSQIRSSILQAFAVSLTQSAGSQVEDHFQIHLTAMP